MKVLQKIEAVYKDLLNKRNEKMILLRKKYKVKVEGDNPPDLVDSFAKMQAKFKLTTSFIQKI